MRSLEFCTSRSNRCVLSRIAASARFRSVTSVNSQIMHFWPSISMGETESSTWMVERSFRHMSVSRFLTDPCKRASWTTAARASGVGHRPISSDVWPIVSSWLYPRMRVKASLTSIMSPSSRRLTTIISGLARKISASLRSLLWRASSRWRRCVMSMSVPAARRGAPEASRSMTLPRLSVHSHEPSLWCMRNSTSKKGLHAAACSASAVRRRGRSDGGMRASQVRGRAGSERS